MRQNYWRVQLGLVPVVTVIVFLLKLTGFKMTNSRLLLNMPLPVI